MSKVEKIEIKEIWEEESEREEGWEKEIKELKKLIETQGLLQPIGVAEKANKETKQKFKLIFGRRRLQACKELGMSSIDAKIAPKKLTQKQEYFWRLSENMGRQDLKPLEEAKMFFAGLESKIISRKELADQLGKTPGYISQRLSLLKLPEEIKEALSSGNITTTHARELSRITDEKVQRRLLKDAQNLNAEKFKEKVANLEDKSKKKTERGRPRIKETKNTPRAEKEVVETLGKLDVELKNTEDKLKVEYYKGLIRGISWAMNWEKKIF